MTTGPVKGNLLLLYIASVVIGCTTDLTASLQRKTIDATCKDNDGAEQYLVGGTGGTFSVSGIWKFDAGFGIGDLIDAWMAGNIVTLKESTEVSGDFYLQCSALITNVELKAGLNAVASYTVTFQITGPITKGVVG